MNLTPLIFFQVFVAGHDSTLKAFAVATIMESAIPRLKPRLVSAASRDSELVKSTIFYPIFYPRESMRIKNDALHAVAYPWSLL